MRDAAPNARRNQAGLHGPAPSATLIDLAAHRRGPARAAESPAEPGLAPGVVACIGAQLRGYYAGIMDEPVPERFSRLIGLLDPAPPRPDGEA